MRSALVAAALVSHFFEQQDETSPSRRLAAARARLRVERAPVAFAVGAGPLWSFGDEKRSRSRMTASVGLILR